MKRSTTPYVSEQGKLVSLDGKADVKERAEAIIRKKDEDVEMWRRRRLVEMVHLGRPRTAREEESSLECEYTENKTNDYAKVFMALSNHEYPTAALSRALEKLVQAQKEGHPYAMALAVNSMKEQGYEDIPPLKPSGVVSKR